MAGIKKSKDGHLGDEGEVRTIFQSILKKRRVSMWSGFNWFRPGIGG
jgi:hypothetical protein